MGELESQIHFNRSVRFLFKVYQFFGLVSFTYDQVTKRVQVSLDKQWRFIRALGWCCFSNLVVTVMLLQKLPFSRYVKLEEILLYARTILMTSNAFMLSISYIRHRRTIVVTVNRLIALSERIHRLTDDGSLFYPASFRKFIIVRLALFLAIGVVTFFTFDSILGIIPCVLIQHTMTLMEFTFWAHLYGNLTLICFYQKMNHLLSVLRATARNKSKIKRRIRKMISISYEIHWVKQKFNDVFCIFHIAYVIVFFTDTHVVYDLLRVLVIVELGRVRLSLSRILFIFCKIAFSKSLALHYLQLNSHIAELLLHSEKTFRRKLLTMFYANEALSKDPVQQREIDLVLVHHHIQDLATKTFRFFVINHRFVCAFITEVVVFYAIVAFQQYVGEFVAASGERLEILQRLATHG